MGQMNNQIVITFGNEEILTQLKAEHPDRDLIMYQALSQPGEYMLLDYSGKDSVFKAPVFYDIISHSGEDKWKGFISFSTLDLNFDQQKVFDARINKLRSDGLPDGMHSIYSLNYHKDISQRIILGTWDDYSDFELWKNSSDEFIPKEYRDSPNFYSHEAYYTPAPKKTSK
ncbi:hypothetical protein FD17_GL001911 [Lentilactobacillus sunkii DSM 19904]|uniref:Monooxygenase n=2 Tax=Lentilactobacillus sunkii TaxID=481719 RepID=A0A0R1L917_9LACO|nr:hypothetical protein FD17_GL001911 [Lentilactobacillus sunkii DSM 19904]